MTTTQQQANTAAYAEGFASTTRVLRAGDNTWKGVLDNLDRTDREPVSPETFWRRAGVRVAAVRWMEGDRD